MDIIFVDFAKKKKKIAVTGVYVTSQLTRRFQIYNGQKRKKAPVVEKCLS